MKKPMFVIDEDSFGQWSWYLLAANGKCLAHSNKGFRSKRDCERALEAVYGAIFDAGQKP